jgi:hypothetical protein
MVADLVTLRLCGMNSTKAALSKWVQQACSVFHQARRWVFGMQATIEAMYLIIQAILYTCIVYFIAGFAKDAGQPFLQSSSCSIASLPCSPPSPVPMRQVT